MKLIEPLVIIVHKVPTLVLLEQQDAFPVLQDIILPGLDLLSVSVAMQDPMKSIEPVVPNVQLQPLK